MAAVLFTITSLSPAQVSRTPPRTPPHPSSCSHRTGLSGGLSLCSLPPEGGVCTRAERAVLTQGQSNRGFRHCGGTAGEGDGTVSPGLWLMAGMGGPSALDSHLPPPSNPAQGLSCAGYLGRVVRRGSGKAVGPQWGAANTGS